MRSRALAVACAILSVLAGEARAVSPQPGRMTIEDTQMRTEGEGRATWRIRDGAAGDGSAIRLSVKASGRLVVCDLAKANLKEGEDYLAYVVARIVRKNPYPFREGVPFVIQILYAEGKQLVRRKVQNREVMRDRYWPYAARSFKSPAAAKLAIELPRVQMDEEAVKYEPVENVYLYVGKREIPAPFKEIAIDCVRLYEKAALDAAAAAAEGPRKRTTRRYGELRVRTAGVEKLLGDAARLDLYLSGRETVGSDRKELAARFLKILDQVEQLEEDLYAQIIAIVQATEGYARWEKQADAFERKLVRLEEELRRYIETRRRALAQRCPWFEGFDLDDALMKGRPIPERRRIAFGSTVHPQSDYYHPYLAGPLGLEFLQAGYSSIARVSAGPWKWDLTQENWLRGPSIDEAVQMYLDAGYKKVELDLTGSHCQLRVPDWFRKAYPEAYSHTMDGKTRTMPAGLDLNVWHEPTRRLVREFLEHSVKYYSRRPEIFYYTLLSEPEGRIQFAYTQPGKSAFRRHLARLYGSIAALNEDWRTDYKGFDAIEPPSTEHINIHPKGSPLIYHFQTFVKDSFVDFFKMMERTVKANQQHKAVTLSGFAYNYFNNDNMRMIDYLKLQSEFGDVFASHVFCGQIDRCVYDYSFNRYIGKPMWSDEFLQGTYELRSDERQFTRKAERLAAAMKSRMIWWASIWDFSVMCLFNLGPSQGTAGMMNEMRQGRLLRPSAAMLPVIFAGVKRLNSIFAHTKVVAPPIGLIVPATRLKLSANQALIEDAADGLMALLGDRNLFFIPEETIVDGRETLEGFRLLLAPVMTNVPPGLSERLLAFVEGGGTLITSGPFGTDDHYGRPDARLIRAVFGRARFEQDAALAKKLGLDRIPLDRSGIIGRKWILGGGNADPSWKESKCIRPEFVWFIKGEPKAGVQVLYRVKGQPAVVAAEYGEGRVVMANFCVTELPDRSSMEEAVRRAVPHAMVESDVRPLGRVLRVGEGGERYLFLVNRNPGSLQQFQNYDDATLRGTVSLEGGYPHVVELTIEGGVPVPVTTENGRTRFPVRLVAGEAAAFFLDKEQQEQMAGPDEESLTRRPLPPEEGPR